MDEIIRIIVSQFRGEEKHLILIFFKNGEMETETWFDKDDDIESGNGYKKYLDKHLVMKRLVATTKATKSKAEWKKAEKKQARRFSKDAWRHEKINQKPGA